MQDIISLKGSKTTIQPNEILMVYGLDEVPQKSAAPTGLWNDRDRQTADTEKAGYAPFDHDRPFYELDDLGTDADAVVELCQDSVNEMITDAIK